MESIKTFCESYYKEAKKRCEELTEKMSVQPNAEIVSKVYKKPAGIKPLLEKLKQCVETELKKKNMCDSFSPENRTICFRLNNKLLYADYLCIPVFELYQIEKETVERSLYFEILFDKYTMGVIMKRSAFYADNRTFQPFALDRAEWASAKQQIKLWKELYTPKSKEINLRTVRLDSMIESLERQSDWSEPNEKELCNSLELLFEHPKHWVLWAYLTQIQCLPLLQNKYSPYYLLNIQDKTNNLRALAGKLCHDLAIITFFNQKKTEDLDYISLKNSDIKVVSERPMPFIANQAESQDIKKWIKVLRDSEAKEEQGDYPFCYIPLLFAGEIVMDQLVLDVDLNMNTFQSELYTKDTIRILCRQFTCRLIDILRLDEDEWKSKKSVQAINDTYKAHIKKWSAWQEKNAPLVYSQFIHLAAWLEMLICEKIPKENIFSPERNYLYGEQKRIGEKYRAKMETALKEINHEFQMQLDIFFQILREIIDKVKDQEVIRTVEIPNEAALNERSPFLFHRDRTGDWEEGQYIGVSEHDLEDSFKYKNQLERMKPFIQYCKDQRLILSNNDRPLLNVRIGTGTKYIYCFSFENVQKTLK